VTNGEPLNPTLRWPSKDQNSKNPAITAIEFIREPGSDLLAIANQTGAIHLLDLKTGDERTSLHPNEVTYDLTHVPRQTESPALAATGVGGRTSVYTSKGDTLIGPVERPDHATGLAIDALELSDRRTIIAVGGKSTAVCLYDESGTLLAQLTGKHQGATVPHQRAGEPAAQDPRSERAKSNGHAATTATDLARETEATPVPDQATQPDQGGTPEPATVLEHDEVEAAARDESPLFEGDPAVRDHLRALVAMRPHQSVRETKRLLTLWGFYVRLLSKLLPSDVTGTSEFGPDVLTLAEILNRWPALLPRLAPRHSTGSGLRDLIQAAEAAPAHPELWESAIKNLGLHKKRYQAATDNLLAFLEQNGNAEVAFYAECVL
jgi:hypothetical protein